MSTSETVDFELGNCPCGNGKIIKSVTTQDNPWSTADIDFSIACSACKRDWHIQHGRLVEKRSEVAYKAAISDEKTKREPLLQLTNRLVDGYFVAFSAKTKKAEHAEMVRLGINTAARHLKLAADQGDATAQGYLGFFLQARRRPGNRLRAGQSWEVLRARSWRAAAERSRGPRAFMDHKRNIARRDGLIGQPKARQNVAAVFLCVEALLRAIIFRSA